jgi:hypothetical protein
LREFVFLKPQGEGKWELIPHPIGLSHVDSPAINFKPGGYKDGEVRAIGQVASHFPKDYLDDGVVPAGATPDDVVDVLKHETSKALEDGTILVAQPGLQEKVADKVAARAVPIIASMGKPDLVTCPQSSSDLAAYFGERVAKATGAKFVKFGLLKQRDPSKLSVNMPDHYRGTVREKRLMQALERAQQALRNGNFSLRRGFISRERKMVQNFLEPSDEMMDMATDPSRKSLPTVLIVDDVVTTGSTQAEAKRKLEEIGFKVVGCVAMFKQPDSK